MKPGDRVRVHSIHPRYLNGTEGIILRDQPGEPRFLVAFTASLPPVKRLLGLKGWEGSRALAEADGTAYICVHRDNLEVIQ